MGETGKQDESDPADVTPSDRLDSDETAQDNADRAAAQMDELHENVKRARDDVQDQD